MNRVLTLLLLAWGNAARGADRGASAEILVAGKGWELLGEGFQLTADSTVDREGNIFFSDARRNRIWKIDGAGKIHLWKEETHGVHGVAWGPVGQLYAAQHDLKRIVAFARDGSESAVSEGIQTHHFTVTLKNEIYFNVAPAHRVFKVEAGQPRVVAEGIEWPRGILASSDGKLLMVSDAKSEWVWRLEIQPNGSLANRRQFCRLGLKPGAKESDASGMAFDRNGWLYVSTDTGIQVCDPAGKLVAHIDVPGGSASGVLFGGPGRDWMYFTDGERMYRRPVKRKGAPLHDQIPRLLGEANE